MQIFQIIKYIFYLIVQQNVLTVHDLTFVFILILNISLSQFVYDFNMRIEYVYFAMNSINRI